MWPSTSHRCSTMQFYPCLRAVSFKRHHQTSSQPPVPPHKPQTWSAASTSPTRVWAPWGVDFAAAQGRFPSIKLPPWRARVLKSLRVNQNHNICKIFIYQTPVSSYQRSQIKNVVKPKDMNTAHFCYFKKAEHSRDGTYGFLKRVRSWGAVYLKELFKDWLIAIFIYLFVL